MMASSLAGITKFLEGDLAVGGGAIPLSPFPPNVCHNSHKYIKLEKVQVHSGLKT